MIWNAQSLAWRAISSRAARLSAAGAAAPAPAAATVRSSALRAVLAEAGEQGLDLTTVSEGAERVEPVQRPLEASSWGTEKDFSTWDSPAVAEVAFAARRAELRTVAAAAAGGGERGALARAARELMALQASDWAFQITGRLSADYPEQRLAGHSAELDAALDSLRDSAAVQPDPALRNLAPDLDLAPLGAP